MNSPAVSLSTEQLQQAAQLLAIDPVLPVGNLFRTGHLKSLALFQGGNELARIK